MGIGVRRSDVEIIREILSAEDSGLTHVRYSVNLNYKQLTRYLVFLEESGIIVLERRGSQVAGFKKTKRGKVELKLLDELIQMLGYKLPPEIEQSVI